MRFILRRTVLRVLVPGALALATGCGSPSQPEGPSAPEPERPELLPVPSRGEAAELELGTWNLEWFGDPGNGPDDEALQLANVAHVLEGLEVDLWSVQEVVDPGRFRALVDALPGYEGLLATDPEVAGGAAAYGDFGGSEQKVGLLWRTAVATVAGARVILQEDDHAFAGRPPVEVRLTVDVGGSPREMVVILLHAKAGADPEDRARREAGARALKDYLDATWPSARVAVLGDFNDDVDVSITPGQATPYAAFVDDSTHYRFPTAALSLAGESSTVFYPDVVDHHLTSDEVAADYVEGSAEAFPADTYIPGYGESTSDHYPVLTRYRAGG